MKNKIFLILAILLAAGKGFALTTTYTGPNVSNSDTWNNPSNWDNGIPSGSMDVYIPSGKMACAWSDSTPLYTGSLTIGTNAQVLIGFTTPYPLSYNALGTVGSTIIYMHQDSLIKTRMNGSPYIPRIELLGDATVTLGDSTQTPASATFGEGIHGAFTFTLTSNSSTPTDYLTTSNGFSSLIVTAIGGRGGAHGVIRANAPASLGTGNVTFNPQSGTTNSMQLYFNSEEAMNRNGTLYLNGMGPNLNNAVYMATNNTIFALYLMGVRMPDGDYTSSGLGAGWLVGPATLKVLGLPAPQNLAAKIGPYRKTIQLAWSSVSNAAAYNIRRSTTNSAYSIIGTSASTNYIDYAIEYYTNYYYKVSATNVYGEGDLSSPVLFSLPPAGTVISVR